MQINANIIPYMLSPTAFPGAIYEVIPSIHPDKTTVKYPQSIIGQVGYHTHDTACPISGDTFEPAYWSAQTVVRGDAATYVLRRLPKHYTSPEIAGAYCYFNNSAIAVQSLLKQSYRPAIIDVESFLAALGSGIQSVTPFKPGAPMMPLSLATFAADPLSDLAINAGSSSKFPLL